MADYYIDPILKEELDRIKEAVITKDRDYVLVIDGEEGSGKSVLAMQIAKYLDERFNLDNICFRSDQFLERLKKAPRFSCIVLDEAYHAINARSSLTEVNKSLIGVATEMRQRNLFVIVVIPSFFGLDKYFALWRCRALIHVYFGRDGSRGHFVIFPKNAKKLLYLNGKKTYDYSKPRSPYPPCRFPNFYTVDEVEYRKKKEESFKRRVVSNLAKRWKDQRDALVKELYHTLKISSLDISQIFDKWGVRPISQREVQRIVQIGTEIKGEEIEE